MKENLTEEWLDEFFKKFWANPIHRLIFQRLDEIDRQKERKS